MTNEQLGYLILGSVALLICGGISLFFLLVFLLLVRRLRRRAKRPLSANSASASANRQRPRSADPRSSPVDFIDMDDFLDSSDPKMPRLPRAEPKISAYDFISSRHVQFDLQADKTTQVLRSFCNSLAEKKIALGRSSISNKPYLVTVFPHAPQENDTLMAVRIEPTIESLYVEWRRYIRVKRSLGPIAIIWVILFAVLTYGLTLLLLLFSGYRRYLYRMDRPRIDEDVSLNSMKHETFIRSELIKACVASGIPRELAALL